MPWFLQLSLLDRATCFRFEVQKHLPDWRSSKEIFHGVVENPALSAAVGVGVVFPLSHFAIGADTVLVAGVAA